MIICGKGELTTGLNYVAQEFPYIHVLGGRLYTDGEVESLQARCPDAALS